MVGLDAIKIPKSSSSGPSMEAAKTAAVQQIPTKCFAPVIKRFSTALYLLAVSTVTDAGIGLSLRRAASCGVVDLDKIVAAPVFILKPGK